MEKKIATVWAPDGGKVKMRERPAKDCDVYWNIPSGTQLDVVETGTEWTRVASGKHEGYMMTQYLLIGDVSFGVVDDSKVTVDRKRLEDIYDELGDILGMRG